MKTVSRTHAQVFSFANRIASWTLRSISSEFLRPSFAGGYSQFIGIRSIFYQSHRFPSKGDTPMGSIESLLLLFRQSAGLAWPLLFAFFSVVLTPQAMAGINQWT